MNKLNLSQINILAPYPVWYEGAELLFKTDHNILYSAAFELDDMLNIKAYWFRITNRSGKKSPNDKKVQQTIIHIIEEFFRTNPDILLYIYATMPMSNKPNVTDYSYVGLMLMNKRKSTLLEQQLSLMRTYQTMLH